MFLQVNEKIHVFCIDHYFNHEQQNCEKYMLVCSNDISKVCLWINILKKFYNIYLMQNNNRKNAIILFLFFLQW
jgi:hypothetical protein